MDTVCKMDDYIQDCTMSARVHETRTLKLSYQGMLRKQQFQAQSVVLQL